MDAVKIWHVGREASAVPPTQLVRHLPAFFEETEWPFPYAIEFDDTMDYLLDLPKRIQWQSATGSLWQVLVKGRLGIAVSRLSPLDALMEDHMRKPSLLVRDVQRVGHALLPGDGAQSGRHSLHVRENHERESSDATKKFDDRTLAPC